MKKVKIILIFILLLETLAKDNNVVAANGSDDYYCTMLRNAKKVVVFRPNFVKEYDDFIYNNFVYYLRNHCNISAEVKYVDFDKSLDNYRGINYVLWSLDKSTLGDYVQGRGNLFIIIDHDVVLGQYSNTWTLYFRFVDCDTGTLRSFYFSLPNNYKKYEKQLKRNICS
ncbi:MAG: hypothetical protein J6P44_07915 [Bacteroidales bacterium]|nr:hypothetical protein [Bacteroidales bacterium]